jgi:hypothetical protein
MMSSLVWLSKRINIVIRLKLTKGVHIFISKRTAGSVGVFVLDVSSMPSVVVSIDLKIRKINKMNKHLSWIFVVTGS